jgi:hypothetical protein
MRLIWHCVTLNAGAASVPAAQMRRQKSASKLQNAMNKLAAAGGSRAASTRGELCKLLLKISG